MLGDWAQNVDYAFNMKSMYFPKLMQNNLSKSKWDWLSTGSGVGVDFGSAREGNSEFLVEGCTANCSWKFLCHWEYRSVLSTCNIVFIF